MTREERFSQARAFLEQWNADRQAAGFWSLPSRLSQWSMGVTDDLVNDLLDQSERECVYIMCGWRARDLGPNVRGDNDLVTGIPGLWADIDYGDEGHKGKNYPPTQEDARALIESMGVKPSAIIHTGHGLHAWWFFKEPWIFENAEDRAKAKKLSDAWKATLKVRAADKGWNCDSVSDLARVMRIPGTWNRKRATPLPTYAILLDGPRYDPAELEPFLREGAVERAETLSLPWSFVLTADAQQPHDKWDILISNDDGRILDIWNYRRKDLKSASENDLALANHAFGAGWSGQEIVNLLIACRRKNGEKLHLDNHQKYEKTLNKAASGFHEDAKIATVKGLEAGRPLPAPVAQDKSAALHAIGITMNPLYNFTKLIKYEAQEPEYHLSVNGAVVVFRGNVELRTQDKFIDRMLDGVSIGPIKTFKKDIWGNLVQMLHDAAILEKVGEEATELGLLRLRLRRFVSGVKEDESSWESTCQQERPFRHNGKVWISTQGMHDHLYMSAHVTIPTQKLAMHLKQLGCIPKSINVGKGKERTTRRVYIVPDDIAKQADDIT